MASERTNAARNEARLPLWTLTFLGVAYAGWVVALFLPSSLLRSILANLTQHAPMFIVLASPAAARWLYTPRLIRFAVRWAFFIGGTALSTAWSDKELTSLDAVMVPCFAGFHAVMTNHFAARFHLPRWPRLDAPPRSGVLAALPPGEALFAFMMAIGLFCISIVVGSPALAVSSLPLVLCGALLWACRHRARLIAFFAVPPPSRLGWVRRLGATVVFVAVFVPLAWVAEPLGAIVSGMCAAILFSVGLPFAPKLEPEVSPAEPALAP